LQAQTPRGMTTPAPGRRPAAVAPAPATPNSAPAAAAKPAEKPAPKAVGIETVRALKYPPLRPVQIPKVETLTLPNGMKVYLLEDHELPVINGTALVRTGNLFDPADKVGLAGITGATMRSGGTKDKTGDQLDEQLENIAARVESGIGETSGSVSFSAMKENVDEVMGVFRDVLTQPEFRQDKIDLLKAQTRSSISRRNDDPHGVVQREFADTLYGKDTPYGWSTEYATINRIGREDVRRFYTRYFFPANVMLAVAGDFQAAEMRARLEKLFAAWTVKQEPVPAFPKVKAAPAPGTYLAVKQDVTQTFFAVGHLAGDRRDKDYPALEVMADILGGGFQSRLFLRVRTRMGAAYSISASWGANYDHEGIFQISGSTKSLSTTETLKAVQEEVEKMRTAEVTEAELETAKQSALNSLVFAFDTKAKTLSRLLTYEYYGYPKDFIDRYQKALAAVTRADVLRVAKERLNPANFTFMTVGKPSDFGTPLERLGNPVNVVDTKIPEPTAEAAKADEASLAAGLRLLRLVQEAAGGAEKLAQVKDLTERIDFRVDPAAGGMQVKQTDRWVAPNHFRQDSVLPMGKISAYSDGTSGWIATPQGTGPLVGAQLKQVQGDLFRLYFRLLTADRQGYQVNLVSDNTIEFSNKAGEMARLTVDPKTALPAAVTYDAVHVSGPPVSVVETFGDYRVVNGVKVPFKATITQGGRKFADLVVEDYQINTGVKLEELTARPK
jgi:zinc protease